MDVDRVARAVRTAAALWAPADVACLRVQGPDAFDALDALCPADLYLRDGQMLHTLLLDDAARPLVDTYLCRDDEDFVLLAEGLGAAALRDFVCAGLPAGLDVEVRDLSADHGLLQLDGPYAWELLAEWVGPTTIGLPYLSFCHLPEAVCFRAGKTGEYGYQLLVPRDRLAAVRARLEEAAAAFGGVAVCGTPDGREALDRCALENFFFNVRREGRSDATVAELQLQWRVSYRKEDYRGAAALRAQRERPLGRRVTTVVAPAPLAVDAPVRFAGRAIGTLLNAAPSAVRGDHVGLALLERAFAHAGTDRFVAQVAGAEVPLVTVSPPVLDNRSLFVSPQRHSWWTRDEVDFPPPWHGPCQPADGSR
jgi:aminomethyltransferase